MFPSYMISDLDWCNHHLHYWYVVLALTPDEDLCDEPVTETEAYCEVYSDY